MKIRAGYEISYDCPQPTPMILTLSVYPSRTSDLLSWDRMLINPAIPVNTYHDSFGNFCHVIRAPVGRLTVSTDFLVQDSGEPDVIASNAEQHDLENLPVEVLIYLGRFLAATGMPKAPCVLERNEALVQLWLKQQYPRIRAFVPGPGPVPVRGRGGVAQPGRGTDGTDKGSFL